MNWLWKLYDRYDNSPYNVLIFLGIALLTGFLLRWPLIGCTFAVALVGTRMIYLLRKRERN
jgi:hypothetical protein